MLTRDITSCISLNLISQKIDEQKNEFSIYIVRAQKYS